jgi:hypothetical protein
MNRVARVVVAWAVLGVGLPAVGPAAARAQDVTARVLPNGTHTFRRMLFGSKLQPIKEIDGLKEAPANSLLIVFGNLRVLNEVDASLPDGLQGFLDAEGAVLIASDRAGAGGILQRRLGVYPDGAVVENPEPGKAYGGQDKCPYVTRYARGHPLFEGINGLSLATNAPTYLRWKLRKYRALASFPEGCTVAGDRQPELVFAAGNQQTPGQFLLLGGHGVFMNSMMDNEDNFTFAGNCIKWLTRAANRDRVLFIEEGRVIKNFDVPLVEIPLPPFPTVEQLNAALRGLETENMPNRLLLTWLAGSESEDGFARARLWIFRGALFLAALTAVIYAWRKLRRGLYRREVTVPLVAHHVAQTVPAYTVVEQRQQILLHEGNLWEAACELARQCFAAYAGRFPHGPPPPPSIEIRAGWWQRRWLTKLVGRMWDIAYGSPARRVTPAEFRRISGDAEELKAALAMGQLVLEPPAAPATLGVDPAG